MTSFEYLDVPTEEGWLECRSDDLHVKALERLNAMYDLSYLMDGFDGGFEVTPLVGLRKYLDEAQMYPGRFNYPPSDIVMAAQNALRVAAFEAAQKGIVWPRLTKSPRKTFDSYPWEHVKLETRRPWDRGERLDYGKGRLDPTGTTLYFGFLEDDDPPRLSTQRLYAAGRRSELAYSADQIDEEAYSGGCAVVRNVFEIRRWNDQYILGYYFEHRDELRALVNEKIVGRQKPIHQWEDFNAILDLVAKMRQDLANPDSDFSKYFTFRVPSSVYDPRDPNEEQIAEDIEALYNLSGPESEHILKRLFMFAMIDLSRSSDVTDITQENISQFPFRPYEDFRICWDAYVAYDHAYIKTEIGVAEPMGTKPRRLYGFEAYFLIIYSLLFEGEDLMHKMGKHGDEYDEVYSHGGARYVYLEDFGVRMNQMGIDFRFVEDVMVALNGYFNSLGIFLIRKSGSQKIDDESVRVNERIRRTLAHLDDRDMLRMRLLSLIPFMELK
jgi:hypothetical protein